MFALSDELWGVLIVNVCGLIVLLVKMWRDEVVSSRAQAFREHSAWENRQGIEEVKKATNGLSQKLGDAREAKGFSEGGRAEHDRSKE